MYNLIHIKVDVLFFEVCFTKRNTARTLIPAHPHSGGQGCVPRHTRLHPLWNTVWIPTARRHVSP